MYLVNFGIPGVSIQFAGKTTVLANYACPVSEHFCELGTSMFRVVLNEVQLPKLVFFQAGASPIKL